MIQKSVLAISFVLLMVGAWAQNHTTYFCGQPEARTKLFTRHPEAEASSLRAAEDLEAFTREMNAQRGGSDQIFVIPVVFHVIHNNGPENISDAQIQDAVNILTRDFRKNNPDTTNIVDDFQDIASDCGIEFRLATLDPDGNCHTGINRIVSSLTADGGNDGIYDLVSWPRNSYLNIWVVSAIGNGVAGFTNMPADVNSNWAADGDGIVVRSDYVGSVGTSSITKSRTLTHEIGHWLNLYHTWGPGNSPGEASNCDIDDLVDDTPNTEGHTSCNLNASTCTSGLDNVQNYMEYSFCSNMFTWGQRQRMRSALMSNVAQRNQLWTTNNLNETGATNPALCVAAFTSDRLSICAGDTIHFTDASYHNPIQWTWDFGDGTVLSGSDPLIHKNPEHIYETPGIYNVTLTVSNGVSDISHVENAFAFVLAPGSVSSPLMEGFEGSFPANNWIVSNVNSDESWEITPSASFTGDKALKLRNYNIDAGNQDLLYSATFDMSGADTIYLSYKWAYANRVEETDDRLKVSVSGDCGETWSIRKLHKGLTNLPTADNTNSQFTPTSESQWDSESLILTNPEWLTDRFRVVFDFTSYGGNNLYLDDINIVGSFTTGVREARPVFLFRVYPNPTEQDMTLELVQQGNEQISVELYNTTGQLVRVLHNGMLSGGRHNLIIPHESAGLYNLVLRKAGHVNVQKVIFR